MKTNQDLFAQCYAATHEAAHNFSALTDPKGNLNPRTTRTDMEEINRLLRVATGAALELESRLAGNEPPKEG